MTTTEIHKALAATELFRGLSDDALANIAARGIERTYRKGQLLFHAGDAGDALFVLVEGALKGYVTSEDGNELALGQIEGPAVVGEVALADGGPRSASMEVVEQARVLVLSRAEFFALLGEHPALIESYICLLAALIRRLQTRTEDFVFLDLQGRVAKLLLRLLDERSTDGTSLDLRMTQGELASMVGGSRPSVNQVLKTLEGRGYIDLEGKQVVVNDPDSLRRLASL